MKIKNLNIAVIGGSISGLTAAAVLIKEGNNVNVYEKKGEELSAQGAGIALPGELVEKLKTVGIVSKLQTLRITNRYFMAYDQKQPQEERVIWEQSVSAHVLHWSELYNQLRKKIPDEYYHLNSKVVDIESAIDHAIITLNNGKKIVADFVICADGSSSMLYRENFFPNVQKPYAGYIAWRGITETGDYLKERLQKPDEEAFYYYGTSEGHLLIYPIMYGNQKQLNWVLYQKCPQSELPKLLTDYKGVEHKSSLLPGELSQDALAKLHRHAKDSLPAKVAQIICQTKAPFLQVMDVLKMPSGIYKRLGLLGDARAKFLPHVGSAAAEAIKYSFRLAELLSNSNSVDAALQKWDYQQKVESEELHALSQAMGTYMVMQPPEWPKMDNEKMLKWWLEKIMGDNKKSWYITNSIHKPPAQKATISSDKRESFIQAKL